MMERTHEIYKSKKTVKKNRGRIHRVVDRTHASSLIGVQLAREFRMMTR